MNFNRVIIGAISLLVVIGIVVLAARALQTINARRQAQQTIPTSGKLALPSGITPSFLPSVRPSASTSFFSSPQPVASVRPSATPTGFPIASPSGKLPATGLY